jgi:chromosome segregation ATPase
VLLGASAFVAGWLIAYISRILGGDFGRHGSAKSKSARASSEHKIRALEADLRLSLKAREKAECGLATVRAELEPMTEEAKIFSKTLEGRDARLAEVKQGLAEECAKTAKLRKELTGRAEETIRAKAQIRNIETELDVAQAGSDVVAEQFRSLAAEREDLTDRLQALKQEMSGTAGDEPENAKLHDDLILDS